MLFRSVHDLHAGRVLRQAVYGRFPVVFFVQRDGRNLRRAVHQVDGQRLRTYAVLVVLVVPDLLDRKSVV